MSDDLSTTVNGAAPAPAHALAQEFGARYRVEGELGRGAMGAVYRAWDEELEEHVALKVPLLRDALALVRFRREVRLARRVTHPNIARVYDLHTSGDRPFVAMEWIDGEGMDALLARRERLEPDECIELLLPVLDALAAAHSAGVVHRDLKPSNIMVARDGRVVVTDFGIAAVAGDEATEVVGTPAYIAPEQARAGTIDGRADVYALGVVMYEMLAGAPPWQAPSPVACILQRLISDPPQLDAAVPASLRQLVDRLLARDPNLRPTAEEVAAALRERFVRATELPTPAPPSNLPGHGSLLVGRQREIVEACQLLRERQRLLLTGVGGVGKTSVAIGVGRAMLAELPGGAWWIDATNISTAVQLNAAVAAVFKLSTPHDVTARIGRALAARGPTLLILDSVERLPPILCDVVDEWARLSHTSMFVATSRVRRTFGALLEIGVLDPEAAKALFAHHATFVQPDFRASEHRPAIDHIIARLDGLPLALELAAARLGFMSVETLLTRLEDQLRVLRSRAREGPHAAMETTLDGSWALLDEDARSALAQLSVFAGGASLPDAVAVLRTATPPEVLIERLSDHSLVRVDRRLHIPSLVREYARRRLEGRASAEVLDRHLTVMAARAAALLPRADDPIDAGRERAAADWDNLVAAFHHGLRTNRCEDALLCLRGLWRAAESRGPYDDVIVMCSALDALDPTDPDAKRWLAVIKASALARVGRAPEAAEILTALLPDISDTLASAHLLNVLGFVLTGLGRPAETEALCERAAELFLKHGHIAMHAGMYGNVAAAMWARGEFVGARARLDHALGLMAQSPNIGLEAVMLNHLALIEFEDGRVDAALDAVRGALERHIATDELRSVALGLLNLGALLVEIGRIDEGERELLLALERSQLLGELRLEAICHCALADAHLARGEPHGALRGYDLALEQLTEVGDRRYLGLTRAHRGTALGAIGRPAQAREAFQRAHQELLETRSDIERARCLCRWGTFELEAGDVDAARLALAQAELVAGPQREGSDAHQRIGKLRAAIADREGPR